MKRQYLNWAICKYDNIKIEDKFYKHEWSAVRENDDATLLWDIF